VLWTDPGGYDAYRVQPRFAPLVPAPPAAEKSASRRTIRYGMRSKALSRGEMERVRGGGSDLPLLTRVVDQFVIHFDARGTSRRCFEVLQDRRGLSVHFLLDLDGTIYQTLDVKEAAWHATVANGRSIGYDFTSQQYDALVRLTATLCALFPKIQCDYPRDVYSKATLVAGRPGLTRSGSGRFWGRDTTRSPAWMPLTTSA
jgi:hypothetical protein